MNTVSIMNTEGNRSPLNVCVVCIRIGGVRVSGMNELCCFDMHSCILFHSMSPREIKGTEGLSSLCHGFSESRTMNR